MRRRNIEIAISPPVLPAETTAFASPFSTDGLLGSAHLRHGFRARMALEQSFKARRIAMNEEAHVGAALRRDLNALDHDVRRIIAAHPIDRENEAFRHSTLSPDFP
jgi:hypothetical protein